jgi:putative autoinducer-2 (AI-2) aldolase
MTYSAIETGAVGVDMGRNIWQNENSVPMIKAVRSIVHDNATPKEAMDIFNSTKSGGS